MDMLIFISCLIIQLVVALFGSELNVYLSTGGNPVGSFNTSASLLGGATWFTVGDPILSNATNFIINAYTFSLSSNFGTAISLIFWILTVVEIVFVAKILRGD